MTDLTDRLAEMAGEMPGPWVMDALCAQTDAEVFFPETASPETASPAPAARAVCGRCRVAAECLIYALARNERFGIWGGTNRHDRRRIRGLMGMNEEV